MEFLGIVVNPKLSRPAYVWYDTDLERVIITVRDNEEIGHGYLDSGNEQYQKPVQVTGYPRSHTPKGIHAAYRDKGYGTSLYTGLVVLAAAMDENLIHLRRIPGRGAGISSETDTRSKDADAWWQAARDRGLTEEEQGEVDGEGEEEHSGDLFDELTRKAKQVVLTTLSGLGLEDGNGNYMNITDISSITADWTTSGDGMEEITADYYTLSSAVEHSLIGLRTRPAETILDAEVVEIYPDVLTRLDWSEEPEAVMNVVMTKVLQAQQAAQPAPKFSVLEKAIKDAYAAKDAEIDRELARSMRSRSRTGTRGEARVEGLRVSRSSPEAEAALFRIEAGREQLGWAKLKDLP